MSVQPLFIDALGRPVAAVSWGVQYAYGGREIVLELVDGRTITLGQAHFDSALYAQAKKFLDAQEEQPK